MCARMCARALMAAQLRAAGLEDPRVLEAAGFADVQDLARYLFGDSVIAAEDLQVLGVYLAGAAAQAGLARRATLAGASQGLEDSLWAARAERRRARELRDLAQGSSGPAGTLARKRIVGSTAWRPRARKQRPAGGVVASDKAELEKWSQRLAIILRTAQVPSWDDAREAEDPAASLMGMVGKARPATVKKRVRTWELFSRWLMWRRGRAWPSSAVDLVDCIHEKVAEGCFASFPEVYRAAVSWMESRSGLPDGQRFSQDGFFKRNVDRALVVTVRGAESVKKAPRFPLSVVAALEVQVMDRGLPVVVNRHLDALGEGLRRPPERRHPSTGARRRLVEGVGP